MVKGVLDLTTNFEKKHLILALRYGHKSASPGRA